MSRLAFQVPATASAPLLGKSSPLDFIRDADGGSPLYAGYLHGTDAHLGAASEGAPFTDLSGNGRTLTQTGANAANVGQTATGFKGTGEVWLNCPFDGDELAAAGVAGEMTVLHFALHPADGGNLIVFAPDGSGATRAFDLRATDTYNAQLVAFDDGSTTLAVHENPVPSWRATDAFMFGGAIGLPGRAMQVMRGHRGELTIAGKNLATAIDEIGGENPFRVGVRTVNTPNTTVSLATLFYDRVLAPAELRAIYAGMRALLVARVGVDV